MTFSRLWQQHSCHVLHELPRHCSWSPAEYKPSQSLTVVNKAWQFVWSLWKCPPHPLHRVHMLSHAHRRMFSIGGLSLLFYWLNHWLGGWERARWITGVLTCYSSPADPGLVFPREAAQWRVCPSWHSAQKVNGPKKKTQTLNPRCDFIQGELWMPYAASACFSDKPCDVRWHMRCGRPADRLNPVVRERAVGPGHRPNVRATIVAPVLQSTCIQCSRRVELE